jgi:hypothetical protein
VLPDPVFPFPEQNGEPHVCSNSSSSSSGGIGFVGLLTILFIALKLTKVIGWSWWWVLSPILISAGITVLALLVIGAVVLVKR